MLRHAAITGFLHRTFLALLVLGACLQPAMAAACDLQDSRALAPSETSAVAVTSDGGHASGIGDCCANPACNDCCLHAAAFPSHRAPASALAMPTMQPVPLATDFRSSDYPVDIRPPIAN